MAQTAINGGRMDRKIISVSVKRQLTIPQKYFDVLGFNNEAECVLRRDGILVRPVREATGGEFSEQILADLISQGYEGQELLNKFKQQSQKVRPAIEKIINEADDLAQNSGGKISLDELFGAEV